jgi:hypothetical protein
MPDFRILGHMVTHNEMGRYLTTTIPWLASLVDDIHVYDDRSDDGTYEYLQRAGVAVEQRPQSAVSFRENEGRFRGGAWQRLDARLRPRSRDWILCVDADEFVVPAITDATSGRTDLQTAITNARLSGQQAVSFVVAEIFGFGDDGWPAQRIDGFWGSIRACRLVAWRSGGYFPPRNSAGSVPESWHHGYDPVRGLQILHLGYARQEDRVAKTQRYLASSSHNLGHVMSILDTPTLVPWDGPPSCAQLLRTTSAR